MSGYASALRAAAAAAVLQARHAVWSPETRDSIYHHLCALDLF